MSNIESGVGLRPLFSLEVELNSLVSVGPTPAGEVRLISIAGGQFRGAELNGTILPGGADWQSVRSDGGLEISARYLLRTEQGELIEVRSDGLRAAPPEVLAQLARGEAVPKDAYYFRTAMRFRTAAARVNFLNDLLAVAYGERRGGRVHLDVHAVL